MQIIFFPYYRRFESRWKRPVWSSENIKGYNWETNYKYMFINFFCYSVRNLRTTDFEFSLAGKSHFAIIRKYSSLHGGSPYAVISKELDTGIEVNIYLPVHTSKMRLKFSFKRSLTALLIDWSPYHGQGAHFALLFTHSWIHAFPKGISAIGSTNKFPFWLISQGKI